MRMLSKELRKDYGEYAVNYCVRIRSLKSQPNESIKRPKTVSVFCQFKAAVIVIQCLLRLLTMKKSDY